MYICINSSISSSYGVCSSNVRSLIHEREMTNDGTWDFFNTHTCRRLNKSSLRGEYII